MAEGYNQRTRKGEENQVSEELQPKIDPLTAEQRLDLARNQHTMSRFKGVSPDDPINKIVAFCETIVGATYLPEACRNSIPNLFFLVNVGNDLGLKWTHTLRSMYMTPAGKVGMQGDIMLSLLFTNRFKVKIIESTKEAAEYWVKRPGNDDEFEWSCRITWEQAEEQGWPYYYKDGQKKTREPWKDRANMLRWRSLAFTARVVAADLLGGMYLPDEIEAIELSPDSNGTYTSVREAQEKAADKAAEADPDLEVVAKAKGQVIDIKPVISNQEARNEAFLKDKEEKPKAEPKKESAKKQTPAAKSEPEKPKETVPSEAKQEALKRMATIAKHYEVQTMNVTYVINGFYSGTESKTIAQVNIALDALEQALLEEKTAEAVLSLLNESPEALGKNLRTAMDAPPVNEPEPEIKEADDFIPGLNWGPATVALAREVMAARKKDERQFLMAMTTYDIDKMVEAEAVAALKLYRAHGDALLVIKRAIAANKTASDVLQIVETELKSTLTKDSNALAIERAISNALSEVSA